MHALWNFEHRKRILFLSKTDHVTVEWALEQVKATGIARVVRFLEFPAVFVVAVNFVQLVLPMMSTLRFLPILWEKVARLCE